MYNFSVVLEIMVLFFFGLVFSVPVPNSSTTSTQKYNFFRVFFLLASLLKIHSGPFTIWTCCTSDVLEFLFTIILGIFFISFLCGITCSLDPTPLFFLSFLEKRTGVVKFVGLHMFENVFILVSHWLIYLGIEFQFGNHFASGVGRHGSNVF